MTEKLGPYYYGARYLDPKYSMWISTDPALGEYIPIAPTNDEAKKHNSNLPGMGGVFNHINFNLYHYAGNSPVKYTDPDGREQFSPFSFNNPVAEFWGWISSFSSGSDKIVASTIAASNGNQTAYNQLNSLSPYMGEAMAKVAGDAVITGMEFTRDYGGVMAVAAYASGNVVLGMTIDGITLACDITLSVRDYNNSKKTDADFNKMVSSILASTVFTAVGMYTGDLVGKELKAACTNEKLTAQVSNAVGDLMAGFSSTTYKMVDENVK